METETAPFPWQERPFQRGHLATYEMSSLKVKILHTHYFPQFTH